LLFLDVWDPASVNSVNNNRFYLSVVDDFSKYTWLFPLATKSEVCLTFFRFKHLVETFFNTKIKFVQSDNGGEFRPLQSALNSMGTSYRLSCPHTHYQMGTVERKHRHIVETGLSLLATANVPLTFWDSAFETATYLINRLPSKVTKRKSPFESLFHTPPNYKFLKIFGCECWPFL
jgi:IS30 family transposase